MFHLGYFTSVSVQNWTGTWSGRNATEWARPSLYVDAAKALERAGFDCLVFEDSLQVQEAYGSSMECALRSGMGAKLDPMLFLPVIARATKHLGVAATVSTSFYPPYLLARTMATMDSMTGGRVGANLVTTSAHLAAQNFGLDEHVEHDARYEMADEWATLVKQLWHSWQPDAVVADETTRTYVDHRKVRTVDFEGRHHRSRGPLNTLPSPQGHPVLCQAGGSPAGRDFGAKHADLIVSAVRGVDAMRPYRRDIDARMLEHGRKPDDAKVLYLVAPILGETAEDAEELRRRRDAATEQTMQDNLFWMSYYSGVDFAQFDLDAPMPDISAQNNGHRSTMADYAAAGAGKTLRELAGTHRTTASVELVGTPDAVAAQMGEIADDAGADGFLLTGEMSRRAFAAVADGLAPELRKRGLIRDGYSGSTFRENLLAF